MLSSKRPSSTGVGVGSGGLVVFKHVFFLQLLLKTCFFGGVGVGSGGLVVWWFSNMFLLQLLLKTCFFGGVGVGSGGLVVFKHVSFAVVA